MGQTLSAFIAYGAILKEPEWVETETDDLEEECVGYRFW